MSRTVPRARKGPFLPVEACRVRDCIEGAAPTGFFGRQPTFGPPPPLIIIDAVSADHGDYLGSVS